MYRPFRAAAVVVASATTAFAEIKKSAAAAAAVVERFQRIFLLANGTHQCRSSGFLRFFFRDAFRFFGVVSVCIVVLALLFGGAAEKSSSSSLFDASLRSRQNLSVDWMPSSSKTPGTMNNFRAVCVRRCVAMRRRRRRTPRRRRDEAPSCDALLDGSRRDERERHVVERERRVYCVCAFLCGKEDIQNDS